MWWLYFKTIIAAIILTSFWAIAAGLSVLVSPSGKLGMACARGWSRSVLKAAKIKLEIKGREKFDPTGLYLFMSNHKSSLDINALFVAIGSDVRMVSKKTYLYVPFMGFSMWLLGFVFIDRGKRDKAIQSLNKAAKDIRKKKRNTLIYPEGRRSRDGSFQPFKKGPFHLAVSAKVPIVPIVIMESDKLMPPDKYFARPGSIYIYFGDPIPTEEYNGKEGAEELSKKVRSAMERMIEEHMETVEPQQ